LFLSVFHLVSNVNPPNFAAAGSGSGSHCVDFWRRTISDGSKKPLVLRDFLRAKLVAGVGFEPIFGSSLVFSSLLIVAVLCGYLHAEIQDLSLHCKDFRASMSNYRQKNLCGIVRLCGNCAVTFRGHILCGICAGVLLSLPWLTKESRLVSQMCAMTGHFGETGQVGQAGG
jgi:hypothetical protein